jgi:hypothetical protein
MDTYYHVQALTARANKLTLDLLPQALEVVSSIQD